MKTFKIFSMAALALAMAACSNEDSALENATPAKPGLIPFSATVAPLSGATTRTVYTPGTDGESKPIINVAWKEGDQICIIGLGEDFGRTSTVTVGKPNGDGSAPLSGNISGTDDSEIEARYPASAYDDWLTFTEKYKAQDGTLSGIQDNLDYRKGTGEISVIGDKATLADKLQMKSQIAIWKLTLQNTSGANLNATKVTIKDGSDIKAATKDISATSEVYMAVPFNTSPTTFDNLTIEATTADGTYTYAAPSAVNLSHSTYYQSTVKMTKPVDLSMVDCAGNARATMSTANCYMVHTAGDYKLPLVYGNAIKDGAANSAAWTGVENENATLTFPNHAGTAINAPWITKATTGDGVAKGMGITVSSAELLWQDAKGLITKVGISGDYLTLTVGKDATAQQGNAVVAVKDGSGNIVWSWHIWVTTETFATLTTVSTASHDYQVTPVNLGWVPTGGDGKKGYAPYYQWGRKDPFKAQGAPADLTVYDINGTAIAGLTYEAGTTATIADNIKNPTTHYNNSSTKAPCNTTYYNMWDAQQTSTGNIATATKKTVYDPCPAGFCVPTSNLYYFMSNGNMRSMTTWDSDNRGATWNISTTGTDLFFPASGSRYRSSGALDYVGYNGYCWSASPDDGEYGHRLFFDSSYWYRGSGGRAYGFPVRAVAEE